EHYKMLFRIDPKILAYDLHPDYLSTKYALSQEDKKLVGVQHHHAHIASCMAENGLSEKVIGIAMDGTGYGIDGNIWGCEFLLADYSGFQRYAHLKYLPMPSGDMAVKEPYRMALSYLYDAFDGELNNIDIPFIDRIGYKKIDLIKKLIERSINTPLTSSCGRLFDAVSSLIGIRDVITYEAQSAIELEMIAEHNISDRYGYEIIDQEELLIIDIKEMFYEIISDLKNGLSKGVISAKFHNTLIDFIATICEEIRKTDKDINKVVLSGGVFQNKYLLDNTIKLLENKEFTTYFHKRIPTNDGGISLGQSVIANAQLTEDF
ncbi:MAG: carbamoyltransferase HypF, partial [Candidatus Poribacteria bacterium]